MIKTGKNAKRAKRKQHKSTKQLHDKGLLGADKTIIIGKRIDNNEGLDFEQELNYSKRSFCFKLVAKVIFAARSKSIFQRRTRSTSQRLELSKKSSKKMYNHIAHYGIENRPEVANLPIRSKDSMLFLTSIINSKSLVKNDLNEIKPIKIEKKNYKEVKKGNENIYKSNKIDLLIQQNIKKNKIKKEIEGVQKQSKEEKTKLNKEHLSERNKLIREMNFKNFCRAKILKNTIHKKRKTLNHKPIIAESERRAKLGLIFLDLKNKYHSKRTIKRKKHVNELSCPKEEKKKLGKILSKVLKGNKSLKQKNKSSDYIKYLLPEADKDTALVPDSQLMSNIREELLNEIHSGRPIVNELNALKSNVDVQKVYRNYINQRINEHKVPLEDSKVNKNEICSSQHIIKDINKPENNKEETSDVFEVSPRNRSLDNSPLTEIRLLVGSEKRLKGSEECISGQRSFDSLKGCAETAEANRRPSLFNKNSFEDFTLKKLEEIVKDDSMSKLIGVREKIVKYKELKEKQLIKKMYKAKKMSPKTYHSKRKELEKWVTQEHEEIAKTKMTLMDAWKKTVAMIEKAQQNSINLKKLFISYTGSHLSDTSSSRFVDSGRAITDRECMNEDMNSALKKEQYKNIPLNHRILNKNECESEVFNPLDSINNIKDNTIFIQEANSPVNQVLVKERSSSKISNEYSNNGSGRQSRNLPANIDYPETPSMTITEIKNGEDKEEVADFVYERVLQSTFNEFILNCIEKQLGSQKAKVSTPSLIQSIAIHKQEGIRADEAYIGNYIDILLTEVMRNHKEHFIAEINKAAVRDPISILKSINTSNTQMKYDVEPIIALTTYLDVEKSNIVEERLEEFMNIHNKAIFDSVNEALTLIRPYGLNGEPTPWSKQSRVLFKGIKDQSVIISNIKNMVLDWVSFKVGTLPKEEFLVDQQFDEDYFTEVREKRLGSLLAQEVIDTEEIWLNYEMEETEVKIDLTDMVLDSLVSEAVKLSLIRNE